MEIYFELLSKPPSYEYHQHRGYSIGSHANHVEALQVANRLANDPDPGYRAFGVKALVPLLSRGFMEAQRKLQEMVGDPSPEVRQALAWGLVDERKDCSALLLSLSRDPVPAVRADAAPGLAAQELPETRERFLELLRDPDDSVREAASDCLYYPEKDPIRPEEAMDLRFDPVPAVRAHVARWCSWLPAPAAVEPLLEISQDVSGKVRTAALDALGKFLEQDARALPRILTGLEDPDPFVRTIAASLLHRHPAPEVLARLLAHANDSDTDVRNYVARAMEGRATFEMLPILERLADDEAHALTRWATAKALIDVPGAEAEALLVHLMRDPSKKVATAARKALEFRAKASLASPPATFELRYGREESVATRLAFHGRDKKHPLRAWEAFLDQVERIDGIKAASTGDSPAVVRLTQGGAWAVLPFGPAHWMCLEWKAGPGPNESPVLSYAVRNTEEVRAWFQGLGPGKVCQGRKLAKALGWQYKNSDDESSS
ncbi:HEAT repeat domain-containing protein [Geothrix sp. 21YS21S-2]|uniref:HEAT repeat domain-containing protein n=1 Tax=Geothrix sp. 21YS21S-2 TaxID=3068893 RepID=UPI0027BA27C5|nr:HEAT repeat domain-containing protein [Geothrix sp. 21YS21S-2]